MLEHDTIAETPTTPAPARRRAARRFDPSSVFVALLVGAAGIGLYYMHWCTADTLKLIKSADADAASVNTFLTGGQANLATLGKALRETRATVANLTRTPLPVPASALFNERDPFAFESLEPKNAADVPVASNTARDQIKQRLLTQARALQVQSIMFGSARRSCLINGKLYFEGQTCGEFVIDSIAPDAVYVQSNDFRFELRFRR